MQGFVTFIYCIPSSGDDRNLCMWNLHFEHFEIIFRFCLIQTFKYRFKVSEKHVFFGKLYHRHQDPFLSSFAPYVLKAVCVTYMHQKQLFFPR